MSCSLIIINRGAIAPLAPPPLPARLGAALAVAVAGIGFAEHLAWGRHPGRI